MGNSYPETPGICPDTPDILVGSLEHNYHVNTCRSKSLLIV
jgi:hypothetical protein